MSASYPITVRFERDQRITNQHGEHFDFAGDSEVQGTLSIVPSDGPLGVREFAHPHFVDIEFEFRHAGRLRRYRGLLSQFDLWFPSGTTVQRNRPDFTPHAGPIDGLLDLRADWAYILPDGHRHTFQVKYSGCSFEIMVQESVFLIRCRYYDPSTASDITIYYQKSFTDFLFLRAAKLCFDRAGTLEEVIPHDESYVFIE